MLSPSAAAALLAAGDSIDGLRPIAAAIGFTGEPMPLDATTRAALGLERVDAVRIMAGAGTLRALLVECAPEAPLREAVAHLATRLAARAPHLLWLLLAARRGGGETAIAAWSAERSRPRVAALVVERTRVVSSDAQTLASLAAIAEATDILTHAYWIEVLGREALTRRFYRTLERLVLELARGARGRAGDEARHVAALLLVSRMLFLSFLETKGWLDGDARFLEHAFARCMERGGEYHQRVLLPLFFGTLNTPPAARAKAARAFGRIPFLNGGLFAPAPAERAARSLRFDDEALGRVHGELLGRYRFTAREDRESWSEAAIDPEMLGKAFESLMSSRERRSSGAFYTPQPLVAAITRAALVDALARDGMDQDVVERALDGEPADDERARTLRARVEELRVLDPACGSGAFLVHALEELSALRIRLGDARPLAAVRRELLTRSIFGVDLNPTAVWLCELRLWLSVVIESDERDPMRVPPLPNLDRHIRVGHSLDGEAFGAAMPAHGGLVLTRLRDRYARASGARKRTLERALDRTERALAIAHVEHALAHCATRRRDLLAVVRGRDLFGERVRPSPAEREQLARERARARELASVRRALRGGGALPFAWVTHFPEAARRGGFDIVIGNPPWVRLHRIPAEARASLRGRYTVFANAAWGRGAAAARAGAGFAAQVDLAALFLERSLALLRDGGTVALLLPAKLWRSLAGGGARRLLLTEARVVALEDWSESPPAFDAAVYPSLLVARRGGSAPASVAAALHRSVGPIRWTIDAPRLGLDDDPASPWLVAPPPVRAAFDRLARAGTSLAEGPLGGPTLGVKCGCNEAFVVTVECWENGVARVRDGRRCGIVESALLRPLLRGETASLWLPGAAREWLLWTHDDAGMPLPTLPVHAAHWLGRWRSRLVARADARRSARWWSLFRTAAASAAHPRVVWADVGRTPRALVLPRGDPTVPLNSCYVLPCPDDDDALAVAALLNSPLAAAWLALVAEPARGGYHRYLAWTVALLPLPRDWTRARRLLAPLAARAMAGDAPSPDELLAATVRAYRVRPADIAPLLAWSAR